LIRVTPTGHPPRRPPSFTLTEERRPMGIFSKDIQTFEDLFVHTLQDVYYAENQITKALPKMIEKTTEAQLKKAFETHLGETQNQIKRLDQAFKGLGKEPKAVSCPAIDGIIKEANDIASEIEDKEVLNAALLASAQAVEHYEITRYGTLIAWAKQLGRTDCAKLLQQNLDEEKSADKKLTMMAESKVNRLAA
jgi:ferritin-like metal-binding protein YciE